MGSSSGTGMILTLLGIALAQSPTPDCPKDAQENIQQLAAEGPGARSAYECLAGNPSGQALLIDALNKAQDDDTTNKLSRALALWRLYRLNTSISAEEARSYQPTDLRLLQDGIRAHRGRKSPSPTHLKVFEKISWYQPNAIYTDSLLTEQDHLNLQMLLNPPEPVAVKTDAQPEDKVMQRTECSCAPGCMSSSSGAGLMALFFSGLVLIRRQSESC